MLLHGKNQNLRDRDVHLDRVRCRQGALIPEIKGVAVDVGPAVFGLEGEANAGPLRHQLINLFQARVDLREFHSPCKREVQVFGKTVLSEVAAFERGAPFEDEEVAELALTQARQEPG
jgi:hypothetical protein